MGERHVSKVRLLANQIALDVARSVVNASRYYNGRSLENNYKCGGLCDDNTGELTAFNT
jgi:hypothetical protein